MKINEIKKTLEDLDKKVQVISARILSNKQRYEEAVEVLNEKGIAVEDIDDWLKDSEERIEQLEETAGGLVRKAEKMVNEIEEKL